MNTFSKFFSAAVVMVLPFITSIAHCATKPTQSADTITTRDGVEIYYKDWGPKNGQVVMFSHGWPLNSDSWDAQMHYLAERG